MVNDDDVCLKMCTGLDDSGQRSLIPGFKGHRGSSNLSSHSILASFETTLTDPLKHTYIIAGKLKHDSALMQLNKCTRTGS